MPTIRIELPLHLRRLANLPDHEALVDVPAPVTLNSVLDTLEAQYPVLRGTIRDHVTLQRRAFLRFFVLEEDWTHLPPGTPLPEAITTGREPLLILGAIAGGLGTITGD
jgi:molybdopterin synthase sulfur carrier subunit